MGLLAYWPHGSHGFITTFIPTSTLNDRSSVANLSHSLTVKVEYQDWIRTSDFSYSSEKQGFSLSHPIPGLKGSFLRLFSERSRTDFRWSRKFDLTISQDTLVRGVGMEFPLGTLFFHGKIGIAKHPSKGEQELMGQARMDIPFDPGFGLGFGWDFTPYRSFLIYEDSDEFELFDVTTTKKEFFATFFARPWDVIDTKVHVSSGRWVSKNRRSLSQIHLHNPIGKVEVDGTLHLSDKEDIRMLWRHLSSNGELSVDVDTRSEIGLMRWKGVQETYGLHYEHRMEGMSVVLGAERSVAQLSQGSFKTGSRKNPLSSFVDFYLYIPEDVFLQTHRLMYL